MLICYLVPLVRLHFADKVQVQLAGHAAEGKGVEVRVGVQRSFRQI